MRPRPTWAARPRVPEGSASGRLSERPRWALQSALVLRVAAAGGRHRLSLAPLSAEDRPRATTAQEDTPPGPGDTWNERRRLARLSAGSQEAEGVLPSPQVPGHPGWLSGGGRKLPHLSCPGAQHWLCSRHRGAAVTPQTPAAHSKLCRAQSLLTPQGPTTGAASAPLQGRGPGRPVSAEALTKGSLLCGDTGMVPGVAEGGAVQAAAGTAPGRPQRPAHRREPSLPASRGTAGGARCCRSAGTATRAGPFWAWLATRWSSREERGAERDGRRNYPGSSRLWEPVRGAPRGQPGPPSTRQVSTGRVSRGSREACWDRKHAGAKPTQKPQWALAP